MNGTHCVRARKDEKEKANNSKTVGTTGKFRVPHAPIRKPVRGFDSAFEERKQRLSQKLPIYTLKELQRIGNPYHMLILMNLHESGYFRVVKEINRILKKEETEIIPDDRYKDLAPLLSFPETFKLIAETLKFSDDLISAGREEQAFTLRTELAVKMMKDDFLWLARCLLDKTFNLASMLSSPLQNKFQAQIHCLLAFVTTLEFYKHEFQEADNDGPVIEALTNLRECRNLCIGESWHFRPDVIKIRIKKPLTLQGLRQAEEHTIDSSSLSLYMAASLLEHELLFELANKIVFRPDTLFPLEYDVVLSLQYAHDALQLAMEVREPVALSSALIRFGMVLRDSGAYMDAMSFFEQLQKHAEMQMDKEAEAASFYLLGTCFIGQHEPLNALEMFAMENETGEGIPDVQAEATTEIGNALLCEGQTQEAKYCFRLATSGYQKTAVLNGTPGERLDVAWAFDGISHGQNLWGRLAGLGRQPKPTDLRAILGQKIKREPLPRVNRPNYDIPSVPLHRLSQGCLMFLMDQNSNSKKYTSTSTSTSYDESSYFSNTGNQDGAMSGDTKKESYDEEKRTPKISLVADTISHHSKAVRGSVQFSQITDTTNFTDNTGESQSGSSSTPQTIFDMEMIYESDRIEKKILTPSDYKYLDDPEPEEGKKVSEDSQKSTTARLTFAETTSNF